MNRRRFLHTAGAALLAPVWGAGPREGIPLGIDLGFLRAPLEADFYVTLERLAALGYREVAFNGFYGPSKVRFKHLLKRFGLAPVAGSASLAALQADPEAQIEEALYMDQPYLVCHSLWPAGAPALTPAEVGRTAEALSALGRRCAARGLRLAVRCQEAAFGRAEGRVPCDVLLRRTDPDVVTMQMDVYQAVRGGADPLDYFARYPGRFALCLLQDMDPGPDQGAAAIGAGAFDFADIVQEGRAAGVAHWIVAHDAAPDPLASAAQAAQHLAALRT